MHLPLRARRDAPAEGMPSQAPPEDGEKKTWGRPARIVGFVAVTATLAAVWVGVARSGGGIEASGADGTVATQDRPGPTAEADEADDTGDARAGDPGDADPARVDDGGGMEPGQKVPAGAAVTQPSLGSSFTVTRLTAPLPETASARGTLVEGFPVTIIPVPQDATIVSSSVSGEGDRLQIGLEASTPADPAAVLDEYLVALGEQGFGPSVSPAAEGSTATSFTRDPDGLVLTLRARPGGGTELTIAGTLVAVG